MDMIFQGHVDVESPRKALRQLQSEEIGLTLRASRPEVVNRKRPNYEYLMDMNAVVEKGTTQAKETYEKMNAASWQGCSSQACQTRPEICNV